MTALLAYRLKAEDLFESLKPQEEQEIDRKIELNGDIVLEELLRAFQDSLQHLTYSAPLHDGLEEYFFDFKYPIRAKNIENLSVLLTAYNNVEGLDLGVRAGNFLNRCILKCQDTNITIRAQNFSEKLEYLGSFNNGKRIHIIGDVGRNVGEFMESGLIYVEGNAGHYVGQSLVGGIIGIKGNAGEWAGLNMSGGLIRIYGSTGMFPGEGMFSRGKLIIGKKPEVYLGNLIKVGGK
jgi:hypothetical protein